jgi:hypothetical protein
MPKTRRVITILLPVLVLAATMMWAPSTQAAPTNPSVSPSWVAEGASPAMTFTFTVSSNPQGDAIGVGLEGYSVAGDRQMTPLLVGTTVTCDFGSGVVVTWRSAGFSAGAGGTTLCDIYVLGDGYVYVELLITGAIALSPGTVTLEVSSGVLQAPATSGNYTVTGYVWSGVYEDFGTTSIRVGGVAPDATPVAEPRAWTVLRQGVPMPDSGDCANAVDEQLGWGTRVSGGWQRAWKPWVGQPGSGGGWACIRAIVNRTGHHWSVDNSVL